MLRSDAIEIAGAAGSEVKLGQLPAVLQRPEWTAAIEAHQKRLEPMALARCDRGAQGLKHPVYDFLFTYYSHRPGHLLRWSPGTDVLLRDADYRSFAGAQEFTQTAEGLIVRACDFPENRRPYLEWALRYLNNTQTRAAQLCCFGLHEWAMLYHTEERRHETPLRISPKEIDAVVDHSDLRCTHYDAFRFFTHDARPKNRIELSRKMTSEFDQPGCIHVSMDLYRFAYKIAPFSSGSVTAAAFELAVDARTIDMRASPYDLSAYGLEPIRIETAEGRETYIGLQRGLVERAAPVRAQLIAEYERLALAKELRAP